MREELPTPDLPKTASKENQEQSSVSLPRPESSVKASAPETSFAGANHDHWEQEKEKLSLILDERILRGRDSVAFSELKQASLFLDNALTSVGEIVLAMLRQRARQIIRQEKPLVLQSKRHFELDDAEMREQLRRLRDLLAERLVFDRNELHAAVAFAVRLQFDLITKPRATLEQLLYRQSPHRQKEDIAVILQGLDERHQFLASVQELLNEYPEGLVTKEAFAALCRRAEREVYGVRPVPAMAAALRAYQNLSASIGLSNSARINNQTVLRMLHERGLNQLAENVLPDLTQQELWTIAEIEKLLEQRVMATGLPFPPPLPATAFAPTEIELGSVLQEAEIKLGEQLLEAAIKRELSDKQIENPSAVPDSADAIKAEQVIPAETESPANGKDAVFSETIPEALAPPPAIEVDTSIPPELLSPPVIEDAADVAIEPATAAAVAAQPKIVYPDGEEPLIVERAKLEAQPPGPYPSITRLIDEKSRSAFLKKIFRKDINAYLTFVEQLEAMQTWKEAKAFLDKEFRTRQVNPYSKEAVHLSDLLFSRYFTKR
jgi:hypothetical protein